jgi:release factor glutamine methyltransferase
VPLRDALAFAVSRLATAKVPSPRLNAELLLMFTLSCDRAYLHAHPERELTTEETRLYQQALSERSSGIPAQYITNTRNFGAWTFWSGPPCSSPVPKPST